MTQHQLHNKAITWFKTSSHGMNAALVACAMLLGSSAAWAVDPSVKQLRVGYQKASVNLVIAQQQKLFEKEFPNAKISWNEFPGGPQILEALAVGSIDMGATGDTPPVYAQAGNKPLHYFAYETAKPLSSAILVQHNSKITKLSQLKGKRVGVHRGSSSHYLLVQAVRKAGLQWTDIQTVWLSPADARAAFQKGAIDAWAIWDPYYAAAQVEDKARVLSSGKGLSPNYTFYLASENLIKNYPQALKGIIKQVNVADKWVQSHKAKTASIFAQSTGLKPIVSQTFIQRRPNPSGAVPLTKKVIADQQELANRFSELKIIPKSINIQQAVWAGK
ncbi:sulfonate ABC transporter substrate-binding protein [Acinetobacter variabilis]|nr:sulfonate ABC transporter substrate-binding protein [Acinetobacter variabilis]BCT90579.1 sulfonate ABC transporter substrate-binding protein [Acinetobacter variabilis]